MPVPAHGTAPGLVVKEGGFTIEGSVTVCEQSVGCVPFCCELGASAMTLCHCLHRSFFLDTCLSFSVHGLGSGDIHSVGYVESRSPVSERCTQTTGRSSLRKPKPSTHGGVAVVYGIAEGSRWRWG